MYALVSAISALPLWPPAREVACGWPALSQSGSAAKSGEHVVEVLAVGGELPLDAVGCLIPCSGCLTIRPSDLDTAGHPVQDGVRIDGVSSGIAGCDGAMLIEVDVFAPRRTVDQLVDGHVATEAARVGRRAYVDDLGWPDGIDGP